MAGLVPPMRRNGCQCEPGADIQPLISGTAGGGHGQGVALGYSVLARPDIKAGRLVCPFQEVLVSKDAYYLVCQQKHAELGKIVAFREWMLDMFAEESRSELLPG